MTEPPPILQQVCDVYFRLSKQDQARSLQWRVNSDHMAQLEATAPPRDPDEPVTDAPAYLFGFPMVVDETVTEMTLERR